MQRCFGRQLGLWTIALLFLSILPTARAAGSPTLCSLAIEPSSTGAWIPHLTVSPSAATAASPATLGPTHSSHIPPVPDNAVLPDQDAPGGQTYSLGGTLRVNRAVADAGDVLTYTLILTNSGEATLDITVRDRIPSWTRYLPGSATGATFVPDPPPGDPDVGVIAWDGSLTPSTSHIIAFQVEILPTALPGAAVINAPVITTPQLALNLRVVTVIAGGDLLYIPLLLGSE